MLKFTLEKTDPEKLDLDIKHKGTFTVGEGNLVKLVITKTDWSVEYLLQNSEGRELIPMKIILLKYKNKFWKN